jgi:hypothetical protein
MTMIQIDLPEATAKAAREAGLLTPAAVERLFSEAIRREAGRRLLDAAKLVHAAGIPEMSMDEINEEVKAARAERRARLKDDAGRS